MTISALPRWTLVAPAVALLVLVLAWGRSLPAFAVALVGLALVAAVLVAVHHAEVVAHRVGEPYGSLILALAVTIIEVGLIVTLMISGGESTASLARDTVFAAFMITCNGILGLCLLVGAMRHNVVVFNAEGSSKALATVTALAVLCLVLPTFTRSTSGPTFSAGQLAFAAVVSLALYGVYVFVQTVRHRDYFLPAGEKCADEDEHAQPPSTRVAWLSLALLTASLVAVVGLAKSVSPAIESGVRSIDAPRAVVGVAIALLVLLPETIAAVRAALRNRVQTSINLAFGSALASIGLTIPAIAVASIWLDGPLLLGLGPTETVLLALTVAAGILTVTPGRATVMQGSVHLVVFASFLFIALTP
ncbi:MAG TPA: ionic transporter y4hA [Pseudonocardiaceae bacterium]